MCKFHSLQYFLDRVPWNWTHDLLTGCLLESNSFIFFLFNKACIWNNYIEGTGSFLSIQVRICNQMSFLHIYFKFSFQSFIDLEVMKKRLGACGTLLRFKILRDQPISTSVICLYPLHKENYCADIILSTLYSSINKESTREPGTISEFIAESLTEGINHTDDRSWANRHEWGSHRAIPVSRCLLPLRCADQRGRSAAWTQG